MSVVVITPDPLSVPKSMVPMGTLPFLALNEQKRRGRNGSCEGIYISPVNYLQIQLIKIYLNLSTRNVYS